MCMCVCVCVCMCVRNMGILSQFPERAKQSTENRIKSVGGKWLVLKGVGSESLSLSPTTEHVKIIIQMACRFFFIHHGIMQL